MPENAVNTVAVFALPAQAAAGEALAERLGLPFKVGQPDADALQPSLLLDERGLSLCANGMRLLPDFSDMLSRCKPGIVQRELLVRAAKVNAANRANGPATAPVAIDATAGLGQDSLLLAAAGFEVYLFESDPVIAALLGDCLRRAAEKPKIAPFAARMHFTPGDSIEGMRTVPVHPDVVYLDPMFPGKTKAAATKKKFQLLHLLECPCANEEELLEAALAVHPRKVVVKRPLKGPALAGMRPGYSLRGKAVRYDCLALPL